MGCWLVAVSSWGDEQCILARCLTQLGSGAWKWGNSPLLSAITGRGGRGIGLSGGIEGIIVQIGHTHQRGVTTAAPEPQSLQAGPQERWAGSFQILLEAECSVSNHGTMNLTRYFHTAWMTLPRCVFLSATVEPMKHYVGRKA